ncbi:uncharacterized protein C9orf43 homolog isoform X2 [Hemicordylus capensis]|uniref:uncharacterized protein C9orf43 homolog isoform X2 n=1 Tax=Hemicordylus capensis TaxID=884348 RepID=UPI002304330A|nr:uncharacterized protein C9orf43 homolog isoform X2 [Hemicordylus capensis]
MRPLFMKLDELPTLKIVNLPLNYSQNEKTSCSESLNSLSKAISSIKEARTYFSSSTINEALIPPMSVLSSERNPFPGLNSRMESHTPYYSPISFTSLRQAEKLQVTDLSDFAEPGLGCQPTCSNLILKWVPNTHHRLLRPKIPATGVETPSRRLCVKDLALESILCLKEKKEMNRKKSNKVPTGGQPYLLHLRRNQKVPNNKSSNPTGLGMNQKENPSTKRQCSSHHLQLAPIVQLSLESRRRALTDDKEEPATPFTVQKARSLYRFKIKSPMTERSPRRSPRKLKVALGGSEHLKHPTPNLAQLLVNAHSVPQTSETSGQVSARENLPSIIQLPQEAVTSRAVRPASTVATYSLQSTKKELQAEDSPRMPQVATGRNKTSVKFVEYKSNKTHLVIDDCCSPVHRVSRSESFYNEYCKHLAHRKESMLAQGDPSASNREQWLREGAQKSEENVLPPNPPPPPPSPLLSEISDHSPLDLT